MIWINCFDSNEFDTNTTDSDMYFQFRTKLKMYYKLQLNS